MKDLVYKTLSFKTEETFKKNINGVEIGIVRGYASTFNNIDRDGDVILPNAFNKTVNDFKSTQRPIRMLYQHSTQELIGGFPPEMMRIDEKGLFVEGQINLDVQRGREAYSLARQNVLTDFSIGFSINEADYNGDVREIKEITLWEISMVGEPANPQARILDVKDVKTVVPFQDYPLATRSRRWDSTAAKNRLREFTDSEEQPSSDYFKYFLYYDKSIKDEFGAYKLPITDVVDGEVKAVPRAIFAAAAAINGARGGVDIPQSEIPRIKANIEKYYDKMGLPSPFDEQAFYINQENLKDIDSVNALEKILVSSGAFSRKAACAIASLAYRGLNNLDETTKDSESELDNSQSDFVERQLSALKLELDKLKQLTIGE